MIIMRMIKLIFYGGEKLGIYLESQKPGFAMMKSFGVN